MIQCNNIKQYYLILLYIINILYNILWTFYLPIIERIENPDTIRLGNIQSLETARVYLIIN